MKRSELDSMCSGVIQDHADLMKSELPELIRSLKGNCDDIADLAAQIIAQTSILQLKHSVSSITDVLVNLNLIDIEADS